MTVFTMGCSNESSRSFFRVHSPGAAAKSGDHATTERIDNENANETEIGNLGHRNARVDEHADAGADRRERTVLRDTVVESKAPM